MALRADGLRVRRGSLAVNFLEQDPPEVRRVAFALPRRLGSAVVRNRIRRRLRAVLSELIGADPQAVPAGAMVIAAEPEAIGRTPGELRSDLVALFGELERRRSAKVTRR